MRKFIQPKEKKMTVEKVLLNTINAMIGQISEQGWEGMDRYWNRPFSTFSGLIVLLQEINKDQGLNMEEQALDLGIISKNTRSTP